MSNNNRIFDDEGSDDDFELVEDANKTDTDANENNSEQPPAAPAEPSKPIITMTPYRLELYDWVQCIVSTIIIVMLLFFFVGRQISIDGPSMMQTLHDTDRVLITQQYTEPKNGDIVIIHTVAYGSTPIVKRVIAVAGQTIDYDYETNTVLVDGVAISEPYVNNPPMNHWIEDADGQLVVPEGFVFVMGDNRNNSTDSRSSDIGFVDTRNIVGTVHFNIFPAKNSSGAREWSRFGIIK